MNLPGANGYDAPLPSPEQPLPPVTRAHAVTQVTPAKKIMFFKSGDPQFGGVKMAINRRSFKSFSALMDDLSQKVPLPFGVRTITTPRGTHSINRLEQLEDGGRYICSDKKYVQPMSTGGPGRKIGVQRANHTMSAQKTGQQEGQEDNYSTGVFQQLPKQRKKITLVKNGDPTFRRSVILNRRNARNFKTFLEDISDLLQFTVRKLYTVDGRKVENIQAVLQSPGILICVGREPFKPIKTENVRKSIAEKLPGLGTHSSITSESLDSRKNVNFGLKAKKSIIHPRSASSNKTRFSLSSEKSYPNGVHMSPANSGFESFSNACPHEKSEDNTHSLINDDIEKKVHVNKDGSLSVEMKVRFRLLNEETLQWSTQIKKSSTLGKAKCEQLCLSKEEIMEAKKEGNRDIFSESDDSFYPCDAESYSSKVNDAELEDMFCSHCGMQCQDYDIWKNPMHANQEEDYVKRSTWQTRSSASSTSSLSKFMYNQKTSIDSLHTTSSEEFTDHIINKSGSFSETRDNSETMVRYSAVSRCTSKNSHSTATSNIDINGNNEHKSTHVTKCQSCSSLRSQGSVQNLYPVRENFIENHCLKSQGGSFEECINTSSPVCSNSELNQLICKQRGSIISQSSLQSKKSNKSLHKRGSTDTQSIKSSISCKEEEQDTQDISNNHSTSKTSVDCVEQYSIDHADQSSTSNSISKIIADQEHDDFLSNGITSTTGLSDSENNSNQASSCPKQARNKGGINTKYRQGKEQGSNSSYSSQNSEIILQENRCLDQCEMPENLISNSPTYSKSTNVEKCQQNLSSNQSLQSISSVSECALDHMEDKTIQNSPDSIDESFKEHHKGNQEEETIPVIGVENNISFSRSLSKSPSVGSKCNCVSYPQDKRLHSTSSQVSSNFEKNSKHGTDNDSPKSSLRSFRSKKQTNVCQKDNLSSKASSSETSCVHSPSPPKGKPTNKQLRLTKYKCSSSSMCSDPVKVINGEKPDSARSSTPESNIIVSSKASTEKYKNRKTTVSSTEETSNNKRKNSSSSSKILSSELIPSALPNVTSEEVVHEWLSKISSETMVVEYEMEECSSKACNEEHNKTENSEIPRETEMENTSKDCTAEKQDDRQIHDQTTDIHNVDKTEIDANCEDEKNEPVVLNEVQTSNVNCIASTVDAIDAKQSLPSIINTSVQIMKALINPMQDSKFDRSNSLPEVSPTMGRKLSNSAQVLISCLASLQLLDGGLTNTKEDTIDLNKATYLQLINILQALWVDGPTNKCVSNNNTGNHEQLPSKHYSREDEITPVSSSGVDVNSGSGTSGDGSVAGGGECPMAGEKVEETNVLTTTVTAENIPPSKSQPLAFRSCDAGDSADVIAATICDSTTCLDETDSRNVDENMNEKTIEDYNCNILPFESKSNIDGCLLNDSIADINDELKGTVDIQEYRKDSMNILAYNGNNAVSNGCKLQEANGVNSESDSHSTVKSTSDSTGLNDPIYDKGSFDADPIWVLKLLKKIENEFMAHYVDAMNDFKIRWNLENNENLDEMIGELKNEVGQRIQRSIGKELKKIKKRAGQKLPSPPNESPRRKSSLQAEERRKYLQTMRKRSVLENNIRSDTNDMSSETNEEDLTFSASFGDDSNGQDNDNEFCPCETCIKKKRALKLAKPREIAADAPIMRAFDLQHILKMKRDHNEINPTLAETKKEPVDIVTENKCTDMNKENKSEAYSQCNSTKERIKSKNPSEEKQSDPENKKENCTIDNLVCEEEENEKYDNPDINCKTNCELFEETDITSINNTERPTSANGDVKRVRTECLIENENQELSDEEQKHSSLKLNEDHQVGEDPMPMIESEETKYGSEGGNESTAMEAEGNVPEECFENEVNDEENEITNYSQHIEDDDSQDGIKGGSLLQKSYLDQCSLTQNNFVENTDEECKEMKNSGETSPNGQSNNSSESKQSHMYPSSSSEEDRDSQCTSPSGTNTNQITSSPHRSNKGSFDESDNKLKNNLDDEIIEQEDLDF
ncbi:retinitis pigmentosa 1-like 1 protein [Bombina bombina]|uniref:retinitis pigmentosa 1-like 1 protein n=1 Tax=Bombina bombina TaxID=8345 RepID=UPI00235AA3C8|nr:retinitis pigmentosa 1-like 1 protein [Bombina bombina]